MRMGKVLVFVCTLTVLIGMVYAAASRNGEDPGYKYEGVKKCKMCHSSAKSGAQYKQWESSEHSKAFTHLATPEAKEIAKKAGVEGDPQQSPECLKCHVTAYAVSEDLKGESLTMEEGVSCEACHGGGSAYCKMSTMMKVAAGTMDGHEVGLITPTEELCLKCHNEKSPTFKGFDFKARYTEILHQAPEEK